ncbi:MAG: nuclear transport factor 2 family protein [Thermoleophilaceae bacterium]|nr:nuclear transport factor 2 family protein [Thermoleophilaceae bacterium]
MSSKLAIVEECLTPWERTTDLAEAFASVRHRLAEDIEWVEDPTWPGYGTYNSPDEILRYLRAQMDEVWESLHVTIDEVRDLGGERALTIVDATGVAKSGVETKLRIAHIWTIREGQVKRIEWYLDPERALEAAGEG